MTHHNTCITTIGVTTADRPRLLRRCLSSLIRQLDLRGQAARIIVVDASKNLRNQATGRAIASTMRGATRQDITFIGRDEVRSIVRTLRTACPESLLNFAFRPGASGNRNLLVLLTAGDNVLFVDDDVVCDVWKPRGFRNVIDVRGHSEERGIAFFRARRDVCDGMVPAAVDLLTAHEALLGRSVKDLEERLTPPVNFSRACVHLRDDAARLRRTVVRTTFAGLAGDHGVSYPERLLFSTGSWKKTLTSSRHTYDTALKFREVCKLATRYIVTHDSGCMAFCMGLDNTELAPPFLPVGRNEDGLFGSMLSALDPHSVCGHLPYAVLHDSNRSSRYSSPGFRSAQETRLADLLTRLTNQWIRSARGAEPHARLTRLGEWLGDLASLGKPDFVTAMSVTTLTTRERELMFIERALNRRGTYPAHWRRDLNAYRDALLASVRGRKFLLPIEFRSSRSLDEGTTSFRHLSVYPPTY